jgi:NAD(P)-dependent dehydrogenase (short-subunit alcohol dehydrogenase family)
LGAAWQPTHVYYFATPALAAGSVGTFSHAAFATFSRFYVTGFADTVLAVRSCSPALRGVFYPSTVALDAPPGSMAEYAAAKAAGEALCDSFGKHLRGIRFFRTRLPRMGTDLTASLLPVATQDVVEVMLGRLGEFTAG